jgi:hypoxanthine phosphoribosyltransferase
MVTFVLYLFLLSLALMVSILSFPLILFIIIPDLKRTWKAVKEQASPLWLDDSLVELLSSKTSKKKCYKTGVINSMYYYFHPRGEKGSYTWKNLEETLNHYELPDGYKPEAIVGIKSGGAFIANYLGHRLGVSDVSYIGITNYNNKSLYERLETVLYRDYKNDKKCKITEIPQISPRNKVILLVDDQSATGASVKLAREYLIAAGAKDVKVFCLYVQSSEIDFAYKRGFRLIWPWGIDA